MKIENGDFEYVFPWCYTEQSALCVCVVDVQFQALFF